MKIAFIHPDLGIGGAEQLVVNLCLALIKHNHEPHIFTPYHHQSFPQTHDGTITIHEHGSFYGLVPDTILGKFKGLLAYIRCILCVLWMIFFAKEKYDVVVADQVSVVLPLLKLFRYKTIFYCHYPDKLLSGKRNFFKKIYRWFIDKVEEISLLCADKIYVNSQYTSQIFDENFPILHSKNKQTQILYPAIDLSKFDQKIVVDEQLKIRKAELEGYKYLFSLNRYERKKNINLAIEVFAELIEKYGVDKKLKLVIAGGYDLKVQENIQHKIELEELAQKMGVKDRIHFYTSISNQTRKYLLRNAECVLYTPENEHFGIVPVQAMYMGVPIIADNSGGPKESVGDGCGFLCNSREQWTQNINTILKNGKEKFDKGRKRVISKFGMEMFSKQFTEGVQNLVHTKKK